MGFAITDYKDAVIITSAAEVILAVLIFVLYSKDLIQDRNVVKEKDFIKNNKIFLHVLGDKNN